LSKTLSASSVAAGATRRDGSSFAALRHPHYRVYTLATALSYVADNIEHVISYWVLWQVFQSPMLQGFAVIAHWTPALLFGVHFGHLADRFDCRRLIQMGQALLALVSFTWATLFLTGTLQAWHAVVLLIGHGVAGALCGPPSQLIIHDIVGREQLQSAVRTASTMRQLTVLVGPWVGGILMLNFTPPGGLYINAMFFLPLIIWLLRVPYTGHGRDRAERPASAGGLRLTEAWYVLGEIKENRAVISMIVLGGVSSLLVGNAFQAQMPGFAHDLGADQTGFGYSMLLGANAMGAFLGGLILEGTGLLRPNPRAAIICTVLWSAAIVGFAASQNFVLAFLLLFVAGMLNLACMSMAQTLVQLLAPPDKRGRIVGLYHMANMGLRVGSGVTVGLMGSVIGIHWALGLSAAALLLVSLGLLGFAPAGTAEPARVPASVARGRP
jgi:MFS family permease